jgi:hypothetical protein
VRVGNTGAYLLDLGNDTTFSEVKIISGNTNTSATFTYRYLAEIQFDFVNIESVTLTTEVTSQDGNNPKFYSNDSKDAGTYTITPTTTTSILCFYSL